MLSLKAPLFLVMIVKGFYYSLNIYYILYIGILFVDWAIMLCSDASIHHHQCYYCLNIYYILYLVIFFWSFYSLLTLVLWFPFLCIFPNFPSFYPTVASHTWTLHILLKHVVNVSLMLPLDSAPGASVRSYIHCRRFPLLQSLSCAALLFPLPNRII